MTHVLACESLINRHVICIINYSAYGLGLDTKGAMGAVAGYDCLHPPPGQNMGFHNNIMELLRSNFPRTVLRVRIQIGT